MRIKLNGNWHVKYERGPRNAEPSYPLQLTMTPGRCARCKGVILLALGLYGVDVRNMRARAVRTVCDDCVSKLQPKERTEYVD